MEDFETPLITTRIVRLKEDEPSLKKLKPQIPQIRIKQKPESFESLSISDSDCECVKKYIKFESTLQFRLNNKNNANYSWFIRARLDVIKWVLKMRFLWGLRSPTVYTSLIYFDRFFKKTTYTNRRDVFTIAIACLSLAAKIQERKKAPPLSVYSLIKPHDLEKLEIQNMEMLVVSTLKWKMYLVTPFDYIHYYVKELFGIIGREGEILSRAVELVLAVMGEINTAEQKTSIVAAAAVLTAYDHELTKTGLMIQMSLIRSWGCHDHEVVFSCYKLMRDVIVRSESTTTKSVESENSLSSSSTSPSSSVGSSRTPGSESGVGTKRKQDSFCDSDRKRAVRGS